MLVVLESKLLVAKIKAGGAELVSLTSKESGIEYVWCGDPKFWGRHTPVLFPIVGSLKDGHYFVDGKEFKLGQHGFARDMAFVIKKQTVDSVELSLGANEATFEKYPFKFELNISYQLSDDGISTNWEVVNKDDKKIFFGIGGHPAFNVPLEKGLAFEDYFLEINPSIERTRLPFVPPFLDVAKKYSEKLDKIALTHEIFSNGNVFVYETTGANSIVLKSSKSPHELTLSYDGFPFVGFWSPSPAKAPFVCIEPWWSHADTPDAPLELKEKPWEQSLEVGAKFNTSYLITVK